MSGRVAAIVLAGGRSARFGRDKVVEPIGGSTMLDHVIERLTGIGEVVVVGPADGERAVPADVRLVRDTLAFEGPLAGLATGLRSLDPGIERVIVVGGDMPTLVPLVLERLLAALDRREAAVLVDDDRPRVLPLALRPAVAEPHAIALLDSGERRLRALLEKLDVEAIPSTVWRADDPDGATLRDVDVPDDLPG